MAGVVQSLFFLVVVKPLMLIGLGLNVHHRERLPTRGPAIIVANHNSHLDTVALMSLFPSSTRRTVRPIAAADYFLKNRWLAWISKNLFNIVPIARAGANAKENFLRQATAVLDNGEIVLLFPEGTRGEPEQLSKFRAGIAALAAARGAVAVIPIFMHGFGKSLPRGDGILVPFFCDVVIGEPLLWSGEKVEFLHLLETKIRELAGEVERQKRES